MSIEINEMERLSDNDVSMDSNGEKYIYDFLINHIRQAFLSPFEKKMNEYLVQYCNYGRLGIRVDGVSIYIDEGDKIVRLPITEKLLYVEKVGDAYYSYQKTSNGLIVDIYCQGKLERKNFVLHIQNADQILAMSASENYYIFIDRDFNIHFADKSLKSSLEHIVSVKAHTDLGGIQQFSAMYGLESLSNKDTSGLKEQILTLEIFEHDDEIMLYIFNPVKQIYSRIGYSKLNHIISSYQHGKPLPKCELVDNYALFYLDLLFPEKHNLEFNLSDALYMRNCRQNIALGCILTSMEKDAKGKDIEIAKIKHYIIPVDHPDDFTTFITTTAFRVDTVVEMTVNGKEYYLCMQGAERQDAKNPEAKKELGSVRYIVVAKDSAKKNAVKMPATLSMPKEKCIFLLGKSTLDINIKEKAKFVEEDGVVKKEVDDLDESSEYEFNYSDLEKQLEEQEAKELEEMRMQQDEQEENDEEALPPFDDQDFDNEDEE